MSPAASKKTRVHRPVPATALPPWVQLLPRGGIQTAKEIAAPRLDGPQHAPSSNESSSECEWKRGEMTLSSKRLVPYLTLITPLTHARSP